MDNDNKLAPEELPPPYTSYASDATPFSYGTQVNSLASHLQHHLASLPDRIRSTQQAHSVQQSLDDSSLVDALLPDIESFLAHLGSLHATPRLAHLTLVPEAAVPPHAILSGLEVMRQRGELCQVARVKLEFGSKEKKSTANVNHDRNNSGQSWSPGQEFSDWGRFGDSSTSANDPLQRQDMLWWRDEDLARRLARALQPETTPKEPPPLRSPVQATVGERLPPQKEKKGWFWGKKGSTSTFATKTVEAEVNSVTGKGIVTKSTGHSPPEQKPEGAKMSVTAEEVAFRSENDFGILESIRGWAIVVAVQVIT